MMNVAFHFIFYQRQICFIYNILNDPPNMFYLQYFERPIDHHSFSIFYFQEHTRPARERLPVLRHQQADTQTPPEVTCSAHVRWAPTKSAQDRLRVSSAPQAPTKTRPANRHAHNVLKAPSVCRALTTSLTVLRRTLSTEMRVWKI